MIYQNSVAQPRDELSDVVMEGRTTSDQFIGTKVLPPMPLKLPTGHFPKIQIAQGDLLRATAATRVPGSRFARWQSTITDETVNLVQVPEELQIPDEQSLIYEDYFAFEEVYSIEATDRLHRYQELTVAATIQNSSNFNNANSSVAYTTANLATMQPSLDIVNAIRQVKSVGEVPNTIVIPGLVYDRIRLSADMKSFIAGSVNAGALVTPETLQAAFASMGVKQVLIGDAYVNQSEQELNTAVNPIWGTSYFFVGACSPGQLRAGGVGRTFYWEKEGPLFNIQTYRDEPVRSNVIRAITTELPALTNTRAGYLVNPQYS
jgi:hypothetical protein